MASWIHGDKEKGLLKRLDTSPSEGWASGRTAERRTPKQSTLTSPAEDDFQNYPVDHSIFKIRDNSESSSTDVLAMADWRKRCFRLIPVFLAVLLAVTLYLARVELRMTNSGDFSHLPMARKIVWAAFIYQLVFQGFSVVFFRHALRGRWRPRLFLTGDLVPSVDIIITCCNEDIDVILDTTRAALHQDYPRHRFRVIVTDDGRSAELEKAVTAMRIEYSNLHYTARVKVGPAGWKGGNLDHAFHYVEGLPGGPAEMVAGLDADLMPERRWLRSAMPHVVTDARMGCVCPSQHFYNQPVNDPLYGSQRNDTRCVEIAKDMADLAWCTGSGWIMRRAALISIGGFPVASITEDVYSSLLLQTKGWKILYIPEALQYGLLPETYYGHCKQHVRWCVGGGQIGFLMNFGLTKSKTGKMTFDQRVTLFLLTVKPFFPMMQTIGLFATPYFLFSKYPFVFPNDLTGLRSLLRLRCVALFIGYLNVLFQSIFTGYNLVLRLESNGIFESPYFTWTMGRSFFLPKWLGGKVAGFTPTGSIPDTLNERHPERRSPLYVRLKVVLFDCGAIFHLFVIILILSGVVHRLRIAIQNNESTHDLWVELSTTVFTPPMYWLQQVLACWTPIQYAIWPPDMPGREELLDRDPATGVATPRKEYRDARFKWWNAWTYSQTIHIAYFIYVAVYIGTWWI